MVDIDVLIQSSGGATRMERLRVDGALSIGRNAQNTLCLEGDGISHDTMMQAPFAELLAAELDRTIDAALHDKAAVQSSGVMSEREWPVAVSGTAAEGAVPADAAAPAAPASPNKEVVSQREWPVGVDKAAVDSSAVVSQREWPVAVSGTPAASPSATSATSTSAGTDAGTAAAVAGGAALLIVAAGFTVRRHRKVEPRPV